MFTDAMMSGLFIGIIDTLICLAYNIGKGLLLGILFIMGASAIALPFLFRSRFFAKYVL